MSTLRWNLTFIAFILLATSTWAKSYQNIEQNINNKWSKIHSVANSHIHNIYDNEKQAYVTQFQGEGTKSTYLLKLKQPYDAQHNTLTWEMKFKEDFVVFIELYTTRGTYRLIYTPGDKNSHLQYGLGKASTLGKWKSYTRDLIKDLNHFVPSTKILMINSFVVKGNGYINNITFTQPKKIITEPKVIEFVENKIQTQQTQSIKKQTNYNLPQIEIYGDNPLILKKGQTYVEKGARALDVDGSELPLSSNHQIDIYQTGEYAVIYMATSPQGDAVIDQRVVIVENVTSKKKDTDCATNNSALQSCEKELLEWKRKVIEKRKQKRIKQARVEEENILKAIKKQELEDYPDYSSL